MMNKKGEVFLFLALTVGMVFETLWAVIRMRNPETLEI
jgi:hypothetical protein